MERMRDNLTPASDPGIRDMHKRFQSYLAAMLATLACGTLVAAPPSDLPLETVKLPRGFVIELVARVPNARGMAWGERGTLFVGSASAGKVYALTLTERDASVRVVAADLREPAGVAFRNGALYVSAISRILRYDDIERRLDRPPQPVVVSDAFPTDGHHGRKFIAFGPDGKLYVPVGAPCNVCAPDPERYAQISRMNADGSGREIVARGVRNSVGFAWHPVTGDLWFTDNGRDNLGDDIPPDKLNRVTRSGQDFGFPYCHAGTIPDPEFGSRRACSEFVPPAQPLGPHVAALGMRFYTGSQFPAAYRNQVFIAEHGSWNRGRKIGYRISLVRLDAAGKALSYEPFAEGWLDAASQNAWGRPADVLVAADGSLLVSDDTAGAIYRISYRH
jgi:glucose/arabinose dehydrogenase